MSDLKTEYEITPVAKPRQTQSDRWKQRPCVMKYRAFADKCRASGMEIPPAGAHIVFIMPMPASWSIKKRRVLDGQPHQQVPDVDNLGKSVFDALYKNDSHIWDVRLTKLWGYSGKIIVWKNNVGFDTEQITANSNVCFPSTILYSIPTAA